MASIPAGMTEEKFEKLIKSFRELWKTHFYGKHTEERRLAFRKEWNATLNSLNCTEFEWLDTLNNHIQINKNQKLPVEFVSMDEVFTQPSLVLEWEPEKLVEEDGFDVGPDGVWVKCKKLVNQSKCLYYLSVPTSRFDCRTYDVEKTPEYQVVKAHLGGTTVTHGRGGQSKISENGIDTPFRDGSHIRWDADLLNLPMYVIAEGKAQRIHSAKEYFYQRLCSNTHDSNSTLV